MSRLFVWMVVPSIIGLLAAASDIATAQSRDPCAYRENADQILDVAAYRKGEGIESYVIFADKQVRMVSTYGEVTVSVNEAVIHRSVSIDCKDFAFFERGIARQTVLAYMIPYILSSSSSPHSLSPHTQRLWLTACSLYAWTSRAG